MIHPLSSRGGRNDAYVVMESVKFRGQTGVGRSDEQSESRMWRELKNAEHSACLKHRLPPQNSQATPKPDFISRGVFFRNSLILNDSQHPDSNRGPTDYKSVALPLCYAGDNGAEAWHGWVSWARRSASSAEGRQELIGHVLPGLSGGGFSTEVGVPKAVGPKTARFLRVTSCLRRLRPDLPNAPNGTFGIARRP